MFTRRKWRQLSQAVSVLVIACLLLPPPSFAAGNPGSKPVSFTPPHNVLNEATNAANFTLVVASLFGAAAAIVSSPATFAAAAAAGAKLLPWVFAENKELWENSVKEAKKFSKLRKDLAKAVDTAIAQYYPAVIAYEDEVRKVLGKDPGTFSQKVQEIGRDIEELEKMASAKDDKTDWNKIRSDWLKDQNAVPLEAWIDANLDGVLRTTRGLQWLRTYVRHQLQRALIKRLGSNPSDVQIDEWWHYNEHRVIPLKDGDQPAIPDRLRASVKKLEPFREAAYKMEGFFVRHHENYTRALNLKLPPNTPKFPLLMMSEHHDTGVFLIQNSDGPESLYVTDIASHLKDRTKCTLALLNKNSEELKVNISKKQLIASTVLGAAQVATLLGTLGGAFLAYTNYRKEQKKQAAAAQQQEQAAEEQQAKEQATKAAP